MTNEEFQGWKSLSTTQEFFNYLQKRKEILKEEWAAERFVNNERESDRSLGFISLINVIMHLTAEEISDEE